MEAPKRWSELWYTPNPAYIDFRNWWGGYQWAYRPFCMRVNKAWLLYQQHLLDQNIKEKLDGNNAFAAADPG